MPTAAKLVSAVMLAALGAWAAMLIVPLLPDGFREGAFVPATAFWGCLAGWTVMGRRLGGGYPHAIAHGLTGVASLVFFALAFNSAWMMVENALMRRYDGPMDAAVGFFDFMLKNLGTMSAPQVWVVLICGGIVAGFLGEFVSHRAN